MNMVSRPSGTVTFLMSDIEGSTRRWVDQPDSMRAALAKHDEVIADAVESNGGWLFKHTGDGIVAAFGSARAAIAAAIAAQRRLELPVRMGICSGAAELRGDDYFGPALNRAARTMEVGHGGQILVAASTASLIESVDLIDLGEHRLRDLSQPQRIWQARAAGLRQDFPPLRTLDAAAGNLPSQSTSFLGREKDIADISAMLVRCPAGNAHRYRWRRQDPAFIAGRRRGVAGFPGWSVAGATRLRAGPLGDRSRRGRGIRRDSAAGPDD